MRENLYCLGDSPAILVIHLPKNEQRKACDAVWFCSQGLLHLLAHNWAAVCSNLPYSSLFFFIISPAVVYQDLSPGTAAPRGDDQGDHVCGNEIREVPQRSMDKH